MQVAFVLVERLQGHLFRRDGAHHAGRHGVRCRHLVQADDVLNHLVLALVQFARFLGHIGHGAHLLAGDGRLVLGRRNPFLDALHGRHDGIQAEHQAPDGLRGKSHQRFPVIGADGLGDNLREDQDKDGHHRRNDAEPLTAEQQGRLSAHPGGTDGVGNGVQAQDRRNGTGRVLFILFEKRGGLVAFLFPHCDVGNGRTHQHRFQHRTQEGNGHRPQ